MQKNNQYKYFEKQINEIIKIFHCDIIKFDKKTIIAEFEQLDENSSVHMIFIIKILEMNVNLLNVQHVVLYKMLKEKKSIIVWQQNDKAKKNELDKKILFLVDKWVINKQTKILLNKKNQQNNQKSS